MLLQFKVISYGTRLVIHTAHGIEARLLCRIFSRLSESSIRRIGTFIDTRMNHLSCRIYRNGNNHTTFFLHIIDRHRQSTRSQRTAIQIECTISTDTR